MMFQVENTADGYVVSCYHDLYWRELRNFGDRQGDARDFMIYDCPKLTDLQISALEKNYRKDRKYIRISSTRFYPQNS